MLQKIYIYIYVLSQMLNVPLYFYQPCICGQYPCILRPIEVGHEIELCLLH